MHIHRVIKLILFIIIFCIIWILTFDILWLDKTPIMEFYKEKENTLDIAYIGASNAYSHFNTTLAYKKYGYTTAMFATDAVPFISTKYMIKEIEKYQNPSLYIIEINRVPTRVPDERDKNFEGTIRKVSDSFKFSRNRIELINDLIDYARKSIENDSGSGSRKLNYYFSFLMYHNKWKEINKNSFESDKLFKGYVFSELQNKVYKTEKREWSNDTLVIPEYNYNVLIDLLEFVKKEKLNVLFVVPYKTYNIDEMKKLNYVTNIIDEYNYEVINFNTLKNLNINFNVYGATKYTLYFSKYLKEKYNLPDHRNDKEYSSWDNEYEKFKSKFKELNNKNFDDLLIDF